MTTHAIIAAPERRALVEQLLRRKGIQRVVDPGIPRRRLFSPCELSFAQQRLWLMAQLNPRSAAFNIPVRLRLRGALDLEAVTYCLRALLARHEALRTSFAVIDGEPRQIVHEWLPARALVVDLEAVPPEARERVASRVAREEARRVFDLRQAPLLRVTLIREDAEDHVVLLTMHHILSDGWSMGVLVREFSVLYAARTRQRPAALPPLPVQYADFAAWQRARLRGDAFDRMVAHWKARLADLPTTQLPTDRPKPARRTGRSGSETLPLSAALAGRLRDLSQRAGVTLFATWVAALNVWLHRYSGQRDLAIGIPIANRLRSELEGLIGFFINQLVLRTKIAGHQTFDDVLNHVREVTLDAFAHQDMPFERLVEEIRPDRHADTTPLFQVAFAFHNTPTPSLELPGLQIEPMAGGHDATRFDLELHVRDTGDRLGGVLYYDRDLFEPATIVRMLGHLTSLVESVCQDSSRPISELPFLPEAERHQILEWNDTRSEWEWGSVLDLIDAQVARTPHLTAVVCEDGTWIYQELQDQANRLARWLQGLGVGPGTLVGIWMGRSRHAVAALLATLKAGAAYVPLDPGCPPARVALQLKDAGVKVLLTDRHRVASAPAGPYLVHAIDDVRGPWLGEPVRAPRASVHPDSLAYVIYTSGSTGQPKGVMVTHGGLLNYLCWARETYRLEEGQGTLFHSSMAFDLTVTSVLAPLIAGSTIYVVGERGGLDGLKQAFRNHDDLSFVKATPAHLRALGDALPPADLAGRTRAFVVGGEALDAVLVDRWLTHAPGTHIFNEYGPTETVVGCSVHELVAGQPLTDPVPIGRPIANTQLYVVTSHGQLAPVGVPGELWIGGAGVARGYLGRADITAARFVPDPFSEVPGARVYRSGDGARFRPDGTLEYLGRLDYQVKVRGYRIEPGEIEGVLTQHPAVKAAVVVARRDPERGASLAAYVVANDDYVVRETSESLEDASRLVRVLTEYLGATLPDYMVPASITVLPAFPLAASGKIDRGALPAPHSRRAASPSAALPQTPVQEMLAGIWAKVLGIDRVGVDDNFFELGGHSLLATQMMSRIRDAFGVDLPLRALFDAPTIAGLSERLTAVSAGAAGSQVPPLAPAPRLEVMPLSFAQQRLWFLHCLDPHSAFYNVPFALRLRGPASIPVVQRCIETIVDRHEVLRTRFALEGDHPVQRIEPAGEVPLPVISLEALPEARRQAAAERLAGEEARRPYDLASDPVFRISVLRLAADDHVVLFTLHHIVSDAWSVGVLIRELSALYHAFTTGGPMPLAPLPLQYADFAVWQRRWLSDAVLDRHVDYWRQQLGDVIGKGELFPRRTRAGRPSRRRGLHPMSISPELSQGLKELSRRHQATLFMTLLAAFDVVLHAETGQSRFVVGTDVANRRDARLESLVGFFVNRLVLKADVNRDDSFEALLAQVRGVTLGAYDHQDLPFERLVEALRPTRDAGRYPLFQVLFVLQNTPGATLTLPGLDVDRFPVDRRETTADLILTLTEMPGGLSGLFEFDVDLFDQATVVQLASKLGTVIDEIVKDARVPVGTLAERLGQVDRAVQRTKRQTYAAALDRSLRRKRGPS